MATSSGLALLLGAVALTSCANLDALASDICGNGVVEAAIGEECDGQPHCGAPGTSRACRFFCDPDADEPIACEPGFGCGVDHVCRKPTGTFEPLTTQTTGTALDLFTGDINGDGCHEIVHTTLHTTVVTAPGSRVAGLCPASQQVLPSGQGNPMSLPAPPMLTDLTGDGRPDLLRPAEALFGTGLFVHVGNIEPTVTSMLYPTVRAKESPLRPLRVTYQGADALVLFIHQAGGMPGTGMAAVVNPINRPEPLAGLMDEVGDLVIVETAELGEINGCAQCDEILLGAAGAPRIRVYGVGSATEVVDGEPVEKMTLTEIKPALELDSGVVLRERNAAIGLVDYNLDGHLDVIVNASDQKLHIAYGLGDGHFDSKDPPDALAPDGHTGPLDVGASKLGSADSRFVAAHFNGDTEAPELVELPCPPGDLLASPACNAIAGGCEAVVTDMDGDGLLDIVATEDQQPGLRVLRRGGDGQFHGSSLDSQCPPHHLTPGDFDNDGVGDVAFFDQINVGHIGLDEDPPITALKVAHGVALSAPGAPVTSGRFEQALGLTPGRFVAGASGPQLYAARSVSNEELMGGLALIEGYGARELFAPFYLPADAGEARLLTVAMDGATAGRFGNSSEGDPPWGVALLTHDLDTTTPGKLRLWHLEAHGGGSSLRAIAQSAESGPPCEACVLVPIDLDPPGKQRDGVDELLLLGDGEARVYSTVDGGFDQVATFSTSHSFQWTNPMTHPQKYAPRALVADLDGDQNLDVIARATSGALVALWGNGSGGFEENELLGAPECEMGQSCGGLSAALIDVDADGKMELVLARPGGLTFHAIVGRKLTALTRPDDPSALPVPPETTDFTAVSAADLDGDGVVDLVVMPSSGVITTLRGVPVHE